MLQFDFQAARCAVAVGVKNPRAQDYRLSHKAGRADISPCTGIEYDGSAKAAARACHSQLIASLSSLERVGGQRSINPLNKYVGGNMKLKQLIASGAIAGALGAAALSMGAGFANAAPGGASKASRRT